MVFIYFYLFVLGCVLGSFYNVVGLRVPQNLSIVRPGSHCTSCKKMLGPFELVPVISYAVFWGKCKHCGSRISPIYPSIELATGILFVFAFYKLGFTWELLIALTLISLLVIIFVSDLAYMLIPDKVLIFFAVLIAAERIFVPLDPWWDMLAGAIFGFSLLFLIALISRGGMGGGDIKLYFVIGLALGFKLTLLSFFAATLLGALYGVGVIVAGKFKKGQAIPFGPFIALGTLLCFFYGERIMEWYVNSFLS
ncbi:prepilin peptidase [Peribacillus saganii]|uniref:Prepilin peptidase n=1 Tax=Peribacillus saganii TaxID=2303992 RepID=A0A372LTN6_9BACI|nr:A24 family peptidase [Peribacillus saganii]RFU71575.1 prepilin peptidase [Peribacillus saganii]